MKSWNLASKLVLILGLCSALFGTAAHAADSRPVVFIPGLIGSVLVNERNERIWGSLSDASQHFIDLRFPFENPVVDKVRAIALLDEFSIFGPFGVSAYGGMSSYFRRHYAIDENYFEFAYDWRQSNFVSACDLKSYIDSRPALAQKALSPHGIAIVAHSMGGIVGRLFIHDQSPAGTQPTADRPCPHQYNVTMFVAIATPFKGAGKALRAFTNGLDKEWEMLKSDQRITRDVFFSLPSVYELLPRYARCCSESAAGAAPLDVLSFPTWSKFSNMADVLSDPNWSRYVASRLQIVRQLRDIMETPMPPSIQTYIVAGVGDPTKASMKLLANGSAEWGDTTEGDGTVPLLSTVMRNELPTIFPKSHLALVGNKFIQDQVRRLLDFTGGGRSMPGPLLPPSPPANRIMRLPGAGGRSFQEASGLRINIGDGYLTASAPQTISFEIIDPDGAPLTYLDPRYLSASVEYGESKRRLPVKQKVSGTYVIEFITPPGPVRGKLSVDLPGDGALKGEFVTTFSVLPRP